MSGRRSCRRSPARRPSRCLSARAPPRAPYARGSIVLIGSRCGRVSRSLTIPCSPAITDSVRRRLHHADVRSPVLRGLRRVRLGGAAAPAARFRRAMSFTTSATYPVFTRCSASVAHRSEPDESTFAWHRRAPPALGGRAIVGPQRASQKRPGVPSGSARDGSSFDGDGRSSRNSIDCAPLNPSRSGGRLT